MLFNSVQYELQNEHTRVTRLLKIITSKYVAIFELMVFFQGKPSKRDDFKEATDDLLLTTPTPKDTN